MAKEEKVQNKRNMEFFMKANVKPVKEEEVFVSTRFQDGDGNPVPFVIKPITTKQMRDLAELHTHKDKNGNEQIKFESFQEDMVIHSLVFPVLKDLMQSYGVATINDVLHELLCVPGEYTELLMHVNRINGRDEKLDDLVDDAKN